VVGSKLISIALTSCKENVIEMEGSHRREVSTQNNAQIIRTNQRNATQHQGIVTRHNTQVSQRNAKQRMTHRNKVVCAATERNQT
jgi:hypothetical protein